MVVTYNAKAYVDRCLSSLLVQPELRTAYVVDNGSSDGTAEHVAKRFPAVAVVPRDENLGFAAGCNAGIELALGSRADAVLLLNPDATLEPGALGRLAECLNAHPSAAAVSPIITRPADDHEVLWYAGASVNLRSGEVSSWRWNEELSSYQASCPPVQRTELASGCAVLLRREALEEVGTLDESFFLYWEDVEWSLRAGQHGLEILLCNEALAHHEVSRATTVAGGFMKEYLMEFNRLTLLYRSGAAGRCRTWWSRSRRLVGTSDFFWHVLRTQGPSAAWARLTGIFGAWVDFLAGRSNRYQPSPRADRHQRARGAADAR